MGAKTCCRVFLNILCIALIILDIVAGWYIFYKQVDLSSDIYSQYGFRLCDHVKLYPLLYGLFQIFGTVLGCVQIWLLCRDIHQDKTECQRCFRQAFATVVASYVLSAIPSEIVSILLQKECVCSKLSVHGTKTEIADLVRAVLSGGSVVAFQLLLQATESFTKVKKVCDLCCKISQPNDDRLFYFWTNLFLFFAYVAVFVLDILYFLCEKKIDT